MRPQCEQVHGCPLFRQSEYQYAVWHSYWLCASLIPLFPILMPVRSAPVRTFFGTVTPYGVTTNGGRNVAAKVGRTKAVSECEPATEAGARNLERLRYGGRKTGVGLFTP